MEENKFILLDKIKDLAKTTYGITSNLDRFPKKYQHSLVDKIQIKCLDLFDVVSEANSLNLSTQKAERNDLQRKAICYCNHLLFYIELSLANNLINIKCAEHWCKAVADIKYMSISWRSKDKERNQ